MGPFAHALLAWLVAAALAEQVRDRRLVVMAGVISDIDGVFILFDRELFNTYHHTFGHSFVFGIPMVLILALLAKDRKKVALAAFVAFAVHAILDIIGSNWPIYPFYPLSDFHMTILSYVSNDIIYDVIGPVVFLLGLIVMLVFVYRKEISPIEFFSVKLDRKLVGMYVYPFKYKCEICGKWAFIQCASCGRKVCSEHIESLFKWRCSECGEEGLCPV